MELKKKLSQLRKEKGLTQLELAEAIQVSRQAVSRWEVGTAVPTLDNLIALSRLYRVPMDYLAHDEMEKPEEAPAVACSGSRAGLRSPGRLAALALCLIAAGALIAAAALKLYRDYRVRQALDHTVILNIGGIRGQGYIVSDNPEQFQDGEISLPLAPYDQDKPDAYIKYPDGTYGDFSSLLEPN